MAENNKDIELRSEKVRNIVGQIPPVLLRRGITIISLILLLLFIGAYFVPYPETVQMDIQIQDLPDQQGIKGFALCSPIVKEKLKIGQTVHLELSGYPAKVFGLVEGNISIIDSIPKTNEDHLPQLIIEISFPCSLKTSYNKTIPYFTEMHGTGIVLLSNESILEQFITSITNK